MFNKKVYEDAIKNRELIISSCKKNGFYVIENLIEPKFFQTCRTEAIDFFIKNALNNKKNLPQAVRGIQLAGDKNTLGFSNNKNWNLYRYCSFRWNQIEETLENSTLLSREISKFRNKLCGYPDSYGELITKKGFTTYTSLSLYPPGGYLNFHKDGHGKDGELELLHFKVELSKPGIDYEGDGFIIVDNEGNYKLINEYTTMGDLLLFSGNFSHGIRKINSGFGRIGLFEIPTYVNQQENPLSYSYDEEFSKKVLRKIIEKWLNFNKKGFEFILRRF